MPRHLQYYFSYPLGCVWQKTGQVWKVLVKGLKQYHIFHKKTNSWSSSFWLRHPRHLGFDCLPSPHRLWKGVVPANTLVKVQHPVCTTDLSQLIDTTFWGGIQTWRPITTGSQHNTPSFPQGTWLYPTSRLTRRMQIPNIFQKFAGVWNFGLKCYQWDENCTGYRPALVPHFISSWCTHSFALWSLARTLGHLTHPSQVKVSFLDSRLSGSQVDFTTGWYFDQSYRACIQ